MKVNSQKGSIQFLVVGFLAVALLIVTGIIFYSTAMKTNNVQGYSVAQAQLPASSTCTADMMVCSASLKTCCPGYIARSCTIGVGVAKDRPFAATKGTVCVKVPTRPVTPTPNDKPAPLRCGIASRCRIPVGAACCKGFESSAEGCANTSLKRCLPVDTDGDDIPDLWDDDINGDGTPDVQNPALYGRNSRIFTLPTTPPPVK